MTLTTEAMQEIYEAAVHSEATGDDQDAHFELLCKLEDVGGTGSAIRKLIDMVRAVNREAQPVGEPDYIRRDCGCCGFETLNYFQDGAACPECNHRPLIKTALFTAPQASEDPQLNTGKPTPINSQEYTSALLDKIKVVEERYEYLIDKYT